MEKDQLRITNRSHPIPQQKFPQKVILLPPPLPLLLMVLQLEASNLVKTDSPFP